MSKLDQKDARILFELGRNSRQSIHELAATTKLSRDIVSYRIGRLEKAGVIQRYITIIDYGKFGYHAVRLYLQLQNTTSEIEEQIAAFFVQQGNTLTVYKIDGEYHFAIGFLVRELHEFQQTYDEFLKKYRHYLARKNFSVLLNYVHYHRNHLVDKKDHDYSPITTGDLEPYSCDEKDLQLLDLIKENARLSLLELAKELKMTATGVRYKLRTLEKNKVIAAYGLLLDTAKLGYEYYKVDLELEDMWIIPSLNQFITQHPHVIYRDIAVGGSDFEFDCEFRDQREFYQLIDELKQLFSQKIRHHFYYKALKIYKYSYLPETFGNHPAQKSKTMRTCQNRQGTTGQ